jgi:hypothetical protein
MKIIYIFTYTLAIYIINVKMNPQVEEPSTVNRRCHCED